ncbi:MerR family transcriptional regulator [Nocardia niwae]|uniref:MerR family transcriptional regulator n=1 Tax=Nocardia niwae TaxID=626084 RepID=A0ABV2X456_9NOCA|nr:MerR family transcriptional regulator [Nocardia niwae]
MRIAELSRASGVPPATIKYYVREGLLPPGVRTHRNQAEYSDAHVGRLRLIRALVDIGGVSIDAAKELLVALDSGSLSARDSLGHVQYALGGRRSQLGGEQRETAAEDVAALLDRRGWRIHDDSPARATLVDVCATLRLLGYDGVVAAMDDYAGASETIAATDIALVRNEPGVERMTETAIVGTILGDTLLAALRRLAQEHLSSTLLPPDDEGARASGEV